MTRALDHNEWFDMLDGAKNDLPVIQTLLGNLHGYKTSGYTPAELQADVTQLVHLFLAMRRHQLKNTKRVASKNP
jgi:hypothetical protein